jgi:hypothetical protein
VANSRGEAHFSHFSRSSSSLEKLRQQKMESDELIELPGGSHVPTVPGRYPAVPPPDRDQLAVDHDFFLFEFDFPVLVVRAKALNALANTERFQIAGQCGTWLERKVQRLGRFVGMDVGCRFNEASFRGGRQFLQQLVPGFSYVDGRTYHRSNTGEAGQVHRCWYSRLGKLVVILSAWTSEQIRVVKVRTEYTLALVAIKQRLV